MTKKQCTTCDRHLARWRFPKQPSGIACQHHNHTCRSCLHGWLEAEVATKPWDRVSCPECSVISRYEDVKAFASPATFDKYDKASSRAAISVDPDFRWCSNSSCGSGQYHSGGVDEPAFTCYSCGHSHCVLCESPWHQGPCSELSEVASTSKGHSPWGLIARCLRGGASGGASPNAWLSRYHPNYYRCEPMVEAPKGGIGSEYSDANSFWPSNTSSAAAGDEPSNAATSGDGSHRKRGKSGGKTVESRRRRYEAKSEAYMTEWTKPCPGCKRMFEKNDGCDHIVCTMCDTAFCFACSVIYRPDRNEAPHQRSCPNYYELDPYYDADYVEYQAGFEGSEEGDLDLLFQ